MRLVLHLLPAHLVSDTSVLAVLDGHHVHRRHTFPDRDSAILWAAGVAADARASRLVVGNLVEPSVL